MYILCLLFMLSIISKGNILWITSTCLKNVICKFKYGMSYMNVKNFIQRWIPNRIILDHILKNLIKNSKLLICSLSSWFVTSKQGPIQIMNNYSNRNNCALWYQTNDQGLSTKWNTIWRCHLLHFCVNYYPIMGNKCYGKIISGNFPVFFPLRVILSLTTMILLRHLWKAYSLEQRGHMLQAEIPLRW